MKDNISKSIKLIVTGDFVPGGIKASFKGYDPFLNLRNEFNNSDAILTNLECSFPWTQEATIKNSGIVPGNDSFFLSITGNNNWIFSLANNHAMDYDRSNLLKTTGFLLENNFKYLGAGGNQETARKPLLIECNELIIGILSYSSDRKCVGDHLKGKKGECISILNEKSLNEVYELSKAVDFTLVFCHWGKEFVHYPIPEDRDIAKSLVDAGADIVIGHHAHVIQGYEKYKDKFIFYSLGNFYFPDFKIPQRLKWRKKERIGLMLKLNLIKNNNKKVTFDLFPVLLPKTNTPVQILKDKPRKNILSKFKSYSDKLQMNNLNYNKYFEFQTRKTFMYLVIKGTIRNLFKPQKKHFKILYKYIQQILFGKKYFLR
jgi:poly-gamma-glutamate synthesis protein (capsule biosynthesis protein)